LNIHSLNTESNVFSQRNTSRGTCCSWSNTWSSVYHLYHL
jgi:hypothetical protein